MAKSSDKLLRVSHPTRFIAGAMSGTSADGVDVAIVRIDGVGLEMKAQLVRHHHQPYPKELRAEIFAFRGGPIQGSNLLARLASMGRAISLTYARAVNDALLAAGMTAEQLSAVAAHGQTLFHDPPNTIQWFDPSLLAAEVGCAIVSDFRRADLAAGGQGAPLVPFADFLLLRDPTKNRVLLNLGGIANITWIPANATTDQIIGFDTGPANCVMDHLARQHKLEGGIDLDGRLSTAGKADFQVSFLAIRNWRLVFNKPPKSADIPEMIDAFEAALKVLGKETMPLADQMATACEMAALGLNLAFAHLPAPPDEIIVSGGGTRNPRLLVEIEEKTKAPVGTIDESGIPSEAKEALAFALLGAATLDGAPSNVPSVTGAKRAVVLGSITPKP